MDFSIKAKKEISSLLADELEKHIEAGEINVAAVLEQNLRELLKAVGAETYRKVLEKEDRKLGKRVSCECGAKAPRISRRNAKVLSVFGWVEYQRSYYGCKSCGEKHSRLDKTWRLQPGKVSPVMGRLLAIAGVDIAFEKAQRKVREFLLVEVSDNTIRKQTQLMGHKQAHREEQWVRDSQDPAWLQSRERTIDSAPERLYGSLDGAQVPIGTSWRELKILSWYRVAPVYGQQEPRAQEISYHTDIATAQEFGQLLWATGVKRLADKAKEVIFVCDGAAWIWNLVSHYFPDAVQIVDWYHACQYLTPIAEAVFLEEAERNLWLKNTKALLWQGEIDDVLQACQHYLEHNLAGEAVRRAVTYYTNNQDRMHYAEYRKHGYWIGSGTVESACKQIATARLKISGAQWTLSGGVATAKARAAWLSDEGRFSSFSALPLAA